MEVNNMLKVNPQFYAFRWITILLTKSFVFPIVYVFRIQF